MWPTWPPLRQMKVECQVWPLDIFIHMEQSDWQLTKKKCVCGVGADWVFEGSKHFEKEVKILINYSGAWAGWKMSAALHMLRCGARTNTFCRSARLQLCGVFHPRWGKRSRRQIKAEEGIYHHYRLQSEHRKLLYSLWNVLQLAFTCDSRGGLLKNCFLKCWDEPFKGDEEECTEVRLRGRNCQEICCNLDQNLLFTRSTTFIKPTLLEQFTFHRITRFVGFQ